MRLNQASDFALRILMYLAEQEEPATVETISTQLGLVKSHVTKIVARLVHAGYLNARRGRAGGVSLARQPDEIFVGPVVREIEADFAVVECMHNAKCGCVFARGCKLKGVLSEATNAFLQVLDARSLQSILSDQRKLAAPVA